LSAELSGAIREWDAAYHAESVDDRWPTEEAYGAEGERLAAWAARELGQPVVYDG
jgi:hypothetical protein